MLGSKLAKSQQGVEMLLENEAQGNLLSIHSRNQHIRCQLNCAQAFECCTYAEDAICERT